MMALTREQARRGVAAASAGNRVEALAYAATAAIARVEATRQLWPECGVARCQLPGGAVRR